MEIIYRPSKKRLLSSLAISSLLIVLGIFIILRSDIFAATHFAKRLGIFGLPISFQIIGILGVVILSLMLVGTINLFFQNSIIKINEKGLINNTNFTNVGLILWKDIVDIRINKKKHNSLIFINVKNTKKYYNRIKNPIIKLNFYTYNKVYKTSFVIETANLTIPDDELFEIFKKFAKL